MKFKRLVFIISIVITLLMIPLIAMQFSNEVNWSFTDFMVMAMLLIGSGLLCDLVMRKVKGNKNRFIVCGLIFFIFFLIWAELAVGILGTFLAGS